MESSEEIQLILTENEEECKKSIDALKRDLQRVRTGRANAGILEGVIVDYYGAKTPLSHLGQIASPEPRTLTVQVYDANAVEACDKAIRSSDLGFNPSRDGNLLRISVPVLTEEGRREIVKHLHKIAEDIKVSIRNHRRDSNDLIKKLEKDGNVNKDEAKKSLEKIQKQTDDFIKQVDVHLAAKEAECMEV
jgi:ribosome recycling factor